MQTAFSDIEASLQSSTHSAFQEQHQAAMDGFWHQFQAVIKSYVRIHLTFIFLLTAESLLFALFFPFLYNSSIVALSLGLIFLTLFAFLILRLYWQAQKREKCEFLKEIYLDNCRKFLKFRNPSSIESHMAIANACCRLAALLQGKEYRCYSSPSFLSFLSHFIEKFSCWWHWEDLHRMKEILLQTSVDEHVEMVKMEPTSLDLHTALANAYVMLSGLYVDPRKLEGVEDDRWVPHRQYETVLKEKFRITAERAIEEFKILSSYAPKDPWVHQQLAYSYRDLQMPEEEIREYETLLYLCPDDRDILFKLGVLYFQQGRNAQGLQVYQNLLHGDPLKADRLIQYYACPK